MMIRFFAILVVFAVLIGCESDDQNDPTQLGGAPGTSGSGTVVTESGAGGYGPQPNAGSGGGLAGSDLTSSGGTPVASAGTGGSNQGDSGSGSTSDACGSATITTVQDLESLATCESLSGDLMVPDTATEITNLDGLIGLHQIEGNVFLDGPNISNVQGLSNITSIGKALSIRSSVLASLEGLNKLESIGSHLYLRECTALIDLGGLSSLASIGGDLIIIGSPALTNLEGLNNLSTLQGTLRIQIVPKVPTCEAMELRDRLGIADDNTELNICGTSLDECGGVDCPPVT